MKKIIVCVMSVIIAITTFSQETIPLPALTKQDYLQKSKNQKTAAWIFLGIGAGAFTIAAPGKVSFNILPVLVIGGGIAVLTSIPLFIGAAKNKRKSRNASAFFKIESAETIQNTFVTSRYYPALSLSINLH